MMLHRAIERRQYRRIYQLLQTADVDALDESGRSPIEVAIKHNLFQVVGWLIDAGASMTKHCLLSAAAHSTPKVNRQIFLEPEWCQLQDENGNTPLQYAIHRRNRKLVQLFASAKNIPNRYGDTPLHNAVRTGDYGLIELMITSISLDHQNNRGKTPFFLAAKYRLTKVCQLFLHRGCRTLTTPNSDGLTPFLVSLPDRHQIECMFYLLRITDPDKLGLNHRFENGSTLMTRAVTGAVYSLVKALLRAGADVDYPNATGTSPLDIVKMYPDVNWQLCVFPGSWNKVRELVVACSEQPGDPKIKLTTRYQLFFKKSLVKRLLNMLW